MRTGLIAAFALSALGLAVAAADDKKEPKVVQEGQTAPDVTLQATQIQKVLPDKKDAKTMSLKDFQGARGKNVVLFFFPKAMTPGCTVESCGFRDRYDDFAKLDTVIIGISADNLDDQIKFTDKEKLSFPLFADPDKKAIDAFGVLNPDRGLANRYTFVIDKKGVVRKVYTKVSPKAHPDEVLDYIKENLSGK
jgi:peroxiredoxin Q/BCP